jgi:hypothetical protein
MRYKVAYNFFLNYLCPYCLDCLIVNYINLLTKKSHHLHKDINSLEKNYMRYKERNAMNQFRRMVIINIITSGEATGITFPSIFALSVFK